MIDFDFNEAVEVALKTWCAKDDDYHNDPHHPLGQLISEWGEVLGDYIKVMYKPGYQFEPENELGDVWYYLRILCYQRKYIPKLSSEYSMNRDDDYLISRVMGNAIRLFKLYCSSNRFLSDGDWRKTLDISYNTLLELCKRYDISLQQLTDSNWQKLKPGSKRGDEWQKS